MFAIHCFNLLGVKDSVEFMLCFYNVCNFGVIFWKSWCCIRQCVCFHPASCIITRKLETVSIKLRQLLTVIYNWQYFPSPRKSELSELRIQVRLLTRDTGFNHCHLETRTIHWDQTIIPGRLLFSVLFLLTAADSGSSVEYRRRVTSIKLYGRFTTSRTRADNEISQYSEKP